MKPERATSLRTEPSAVQVPGHAPRWVMPAVKTALALTDVILAGFSFMIAFYLREGENILSSATVGHVSWSSKFAPYGVLLPFVILIRVVMLANFGLYRLRGEFSFIDDIVRVFKASAMGSLLIIAAAFLHRGGFEFRAFPYSRMVFVLDFWLALMGFTLLRVGMRSAQSMARRKQFNLIPTLVVGRGPQAALVIKEIEKRPELGYRVIGVIEKGSLDASVGTEFERVPVISDFAHLPEAIKDSRANEVIITDPSLPGADLFDVMMRVGRRTIEFRIAPTLINVLPRKTEIDQIGALPMVTLFRSPLSSMAHLIKRASDLMITLVASPVLVPLSLMIAILIKWDSKGGVFYKQERVGMDGRIFLCYKFRTMEADADDAAHREFQRGYIAGRPEANLGDNQRPVYKLHADRRITRTGRWLRRTSLDEVPQLLNVLQGDMSIVGPRPPIPYEVEGYDLYHRKRLDMKPGLTGLWQVSGRNRLPFEEMVRLDLYYIENWSLLLDLKIILRTLPVMLRGDAY